MMLTTPAALTSWPPFPSGSASGLFHLSQDPDIVLPRLILRHELLLPRRANSPFRDTQAE